MQIATAPAASVRYMRSTYLPLQMPMRNLSDLFPVANERMQVQEHAAWCVCSNAVLDLNLG